MSRWSMFWVGVLSFPMIVGRLIHRYLGDVLAWLIGEK